MCVVFSIVGCVCWCSRVTISSMFIDGSSYVSFPRPFILCIHFCRMFWERDEWPSPRDSGSLSCPSLRSLLMWLPSMSDLSWSLLPFVLLVSSSFSFLLLIRHPHLTSCFFFLTTPFYSQFDTPRASFLHIPLSDHFSSSPHYRCHVHVGHIRVHGSRAFLYILHFIHEGMSFDHWVFRPSFLSFLLPYHPSLRYVPCLKTTLRPWDQMSSLTTSAWTGVWDLVAI